jgi:16S rRNA (cytosine1402-N4)-methyltransferase
LALTSLLNNSSLSGGKSRHKPVLLAEVIANLAIKKEGVYVDATFGRGGHALEILRLLGPKGLVLALDKDPEAVQAARLIKDKRFRVRQGSFTELQKWMEQLDLVGKVDGILLDLGVSSPQLDEPQRGFSFLREGPLDMRMDPSQGQDAASWINTASEKEIAKVLKEYGEEKFYKRIAAAIVRAREFAPVETTLALANIVAKANPRWEKHKHPATRAFQAIRIFINNELKELQACLQQCFEVLAVGGRLLTISFHSLEHRVIKEFIREYTKGADFPPEIPIKKEQLTVRLRCINGVIRAKDKEIAANPRARSAALRVMEKLS